MMVRKQVYKRFLTKKKLSSFAWTHWGFALITTIGIGILFTFVEITKIYDRKVVFFNIRTLNTENTKYNNLPNQAILTNNSPVFVFVKESILFGSLKNIVAPMPNNDVLILNKNWKDDFLKKLNNYKNKDNIFPTKVFGVAFDHDFSYEKNIQILQELFELVTAQNKLFGKVLPNAAYPSVVFLDATKL